MTTTLVHGITPLAALTSVFTPPCPTSWLLTETKLPSQLPIFPSNGPVGCNPPAWARNLEGRGFQYYSPAICPQGFAVGPSCGLTSARTGEGFPPVTPGENVAYCVPLGMSCTTDTTDFRGGVWGWKQPATAPSAAVTVGPAIQIRWRDSDVEILETHPLTPGLRRQVVATGTRPTPIEQTPPTSDGSIRTVVTIVSFPSSPSSLTTSASGNGQPGTGTGSTERTGPIDRNTAVFVIVILAVLAAAMLGIGGLIMFFRRRPTTKRGFGKFAVIFEKPKSWATSRRRRGRANNNEKGKLAEHDDIAGAELGLSGHSTAPHHLEHGPTRGSKFNPAELDGRDQGQQPRRWSGIPQQPRPSEALPDGELEFAVHRLSSVTELTESSYERTEEKPMVRAKAAALPVTETVQVQSTSRSLTVPQPKPLSPDRVVQPTSSIAGAVSPVSAPGSPFFGNQTRVYSNWRNPDEK